MDNKGGKFRKKIKFTQMSNNVIRDKSLSFKAKGLYSLIQSYITLEDFDIYKGFLIQQCVEGQKAFDSAWKELKEHGYLKQYRIPTGEKGTFTYEYDLLDESDLESPSLVNCDKHGNPIKKEQKDHIPQNGGSGEKSDHTPHFVPNGQSTICSTYPMENGGNINNTDYNNTDYNNTNNKSDVLANKIQSKLAKDKITITKEKVQEIINQIRNTQDLSKIKNLPAYLTTCIRNYIAEKEIKQPTQAFASSLDINELDRLITYGKN